MTTAFAIGWRQIGICFMLLAASYTGIFRGYPGLAAVTLFLVPTIHLHTRWNPVSLNGLAKVG